MGKLERVRQKILEGGSDAIIAFEDLRNLLISLGFVERIKGGHHSFRKDGVLEKPNLQRGSYEERKLSEI